MGGERDGAKAPALSIVVETVNVERGRFDRLETALGLIGAQEFPSDEIELIVVVDPLVHPELESHISRVAPRARVIHGPGLHYYAQKNLATRHARGTIVGFVDSDCRPVPTWAASAVDAFRKHGSEVGAVAGTIWADGGTLATAFLVSVFGHLQARVERPSPSFGASNSAFRRDDLLALPFDEDPFFHGADVRMAARLKDRGRHVLLVPGVAVRHRFEPGFLPFLQRSVYWGYCFLELRRHASASVPYTRLFRRLGPLAPLALIPGKAAIDLKRLVDRRRDLDVDVRRFVICGAILLISSLAVGYGALRSTLRLPAPGSPY